jgi:hypothetical protein
MAYQVVYNHRQSGPVTLQNGGVPTVYQQLTPYLDIPADDQAAMVAAGCTILTTDVNGVDSVHTVAELAAVLQFKG